MEMVVSLELFLLDTSKKSLTEAPFNCIKILHLDSNFLCHVSVRQMTYFIFFYKFFSKIDSAIAEQKLMLLMLKYNKFSSCFKNTLQ